MRCFASTLKRGSNYRGNTMTEKMDDAISKVLGGILENNSSVIFLGAGASYDSGLPLGNEAAEKVVSACFRALGLQHHCDALSRCDSSRSSAWPRLEVVLDIVARYIADAPAGIIRTFQDVGLSSANQFLANHSQYSWLWLTTNFDNQIERALGLRGITPFVVAKRQQMRTHQLSDSQFTVVKLHGDLSVADSDSDRGVRIDEILRDFPDEARRCIADRAAGHPFLCIGYAARDPDLRQLLKELVERASIAVWIGFGAVPNPSISDLVGKNANASYYGGGFAQVLAQCLSVRLPPPVLERSWEISIMDWVYKQPSYELALGLAALCNTRDDFPFREVVPDILRIVPDTTLYALFKDEIEIARLSRLPNQEDALTSLADKQLARLQQLPSIDSNAEVRAFTLVGEAYFRAGAFNKCVEALRLLKPEDLNAADSSVRIQFLRRRGYAQQYVGQDELKEGLETLREAVELARNADLPQEIAKASCDLAVAYTECGNPEEAIAILESVNSIVEEVGTPRNSMFLRACLADAHRYQREWEKADVELKELLSEAATLNDNEWYLSLRSNHGACLVGMSKVAEAEEALADVIKRIHLDTPAQFLGHTLFYRAWLRVLLGEWRGAIDWLKRACSVFERQGSRDGVGGSLALNAWCCLRLNQLAEGRNLIRYIQEAKLTPAGQFAKHFKFAHWAMENYPPSAGHWVSMVIREFDDYPEQRFLLLAWGLEIFGGELMADDAARTIAASAQAIIASRCGLFASILRRLIADFDLTVSPRAEQTISDWSPGDIIELRSHLLS